jgi:hypothetical protein
LLNSTIWTSTIPVTLEVIPLDIFISVLELNFVA